MIFFLFSFNKTYFSQKTNVLITPPDKKDPTFIPIYLFLKHTPLKIGLFIILLLYRIAELKKRD